MDMLRSASFPLLSLADCIVIAAFTAPLSPTTAEARPRSLSMPSPTIPSASATTHATTASGISATRVFPKLVIRAASAPLAALSSIGNARYCSPCCCSHSHTFPFPDPATPTTSTTTLFCPASISSTPAAARALPGSSVLPTTSFDIAGNMAVSPA